MRQKIYTKEAEEKEIELLRQERKIDIRVAELSGLKVSFPVHSWEYTVDVYVTDNGKEYRLLPHYTQSLDAAWELLWYLQNDRLTTKDMVHLYGLRREDAALFLCEQFIKYKEAENGNR